jgi:hypothetical protein
LVLLRLLSLILLVRVARCGPPESVREPGPKLVEALNVVHPKGARAARTREV